ncbi:uncharacterized protein CMU_007330 [Cryptosporidium muris RN66]|uniref:Uncharacterized protein n=1 Tax=Cryptosporidium muris (strain RN66) TaxID=441375 RepID=B6ADF3_CRYMR|nr:uncharacterized protein CMU_007330 [Cryptosporidium muris RN66]EEA06244.1 hypothetical protein CMU_007330 [Cryptosporidium muris RN66]|eukprot:XP_002140593.1 hypothetical protein [Cryptosporidium muris RN66]
MRIVQQTSLKMIKQLKENLLMGHPTAIFLIFVFLSFVILCPFICYIEASKKKLKKRKQKKRSKKVTKKNDSSCNNAIQTTSDEQSKSMKDLDTPNTIYFNNELNNEKKVINQQSITPNTYTTISSKPNSLEDDDGQWHTVGKQKKKTDLLQELPPNNESTNKPTGNRRLNAKKAKPINRVPGMTD